MQPSLFLIPLLLVLRGDGHKRMSLLAPVSDNDLFGFADDISANDAFVRGLQCLPSPGQDVYFLMGVQRTKQRLGGAQT